MPERRKKSSGAFWSGTITFGLVSIPVELFPGTRNRRVALRMVAPDGTLLRRRYFCPQEERMVTRDELVRGYEYEKDRYVLVTDEELESLEPKKSREIDLQRFVPVDQIDPMYVDRPYYFAPAGDALKPYRLLAEVMEKTQRAGIATFVMRGREYLVAIVSENGLLRAVTLRFAAEVRQPEEIGMPEPNPASPARVKEFERQIQSSAAEDIDPGAMEDEYSQRLLETIERKKAAGEGVVRPPLEEIEAAEEDDNVIDIMEALKRSVEKENRSKSGSAGKPKAKREAENTIEKLQKKTKKELYEEAQELDVAGRSHMDKEELIEAIRISRQ